MTHMRTMLPEGFRDYDWADASQRNVSLAVSNGERVGMRSPNPQQAAFFNRLAPEARGIPDPRLERHATDSERQFTLPDVPKAQSISKHGNVAEMAQCSGGFKKLGASVNQLQSLLHAA